MAIRFWTIIGRLERVVRVPFRTRLLAVTGGTTAGFVGEGAPSPCTAADLLGSELLPQKIGPIAVLSSELVRVHSVPAEVHESRRRLPAMQAAGAANWDDCPGRYAVRLTQSRDFAVNLHQHSGPH